MFGTVIWSLDPTTGAAAVVPSKDGNVYHDPQYTASANGAVYFVAYSDGAQDLYGSSSLQVWVLGPAAPGSEQTLAGDFNHDNVVDAGDYVFLRKHGGSTENYALYRANFGRSIPAAGSDLAISANVTSQDAAETLLKGAGQSSQTLKDQANTFASVKALVAPSETSQSAANSDVESGLGELPPDTSMSYWNDFVETHASDSIGSNVRVRRYGAPQRSAEAIVRNWSLVTTHNRPFNEPERAVDGEMKDWILEFESEPKEIDIQAIDDVFSDVHTFASPS
jgi:hypothetical protein